MLKTIRLFGITLLLSLLVSSASAERQSTRLELIPPSPVTNKIMLDIRGAVENTGSKPEKYAISLYLDREEPSAKLYEQNLQIPAHSSMGVYYRHSTADWTGKHRLILTATTPKSRQQAERELEVISSDVRSTRTIDGAWAGIVHWSDVEGRYWNADIRKMTEEDWRDQVRGMHSLGMDTVVIQEVFRNQQYYGRNTIASAGYKGAAFYPSKLFSARVPRASNDPLEAILSEADKQRMNVFLGVGMYAWFDFSADSLEWHKEIATELWKRYGHHPSFYGWYVSEEVYGNLIPDQGEQLKQQYRQEIETFFRNFQAHCRKLAPEKPVMLAPNAHGLRMSQTAWPAILKYIDILCPFGFHRMPEGDITGEEAANLWQSLADQTGTHLWMDMEAFLFEGEALIPRPIDGLILDLRRFPNFEKILCYQYPGMFNSPNSRMKPGGPRTVLLYQDYLHYVQGQHNTIPTH